MKKINIGIIGTGAIAEHHARVLSSFDDAVIRAAASRRTEPRELFCASHHIPANYENHQDMKAAEKELDALYILVSAENIFNVTKECISYGLPLFIEKPPGLSLRETKELARLARERNIPVMVGLNRRFYSIIRAAKAAIEKQGPLLGIVVEAPEWIQKIRMAGKFPDAVLEKWAVLNGIHVIDLVRFFAGDVKNITSFRHALQEKNGDNFGALLTFKNNPAIGHYISHWQSPGRWKIDLYGKDVRAHMEPLEEGVIIEKDSPPVIIEPDAHDKEFKPGFWAQNRYFIDRVRDKKPISYPASSIEDAEKTMELVEQIANAPLL